MQTTRAHYEIESGPTTATSTAEYLIAEPVSDGGEWPQAQFRRSGFSNVPRWLLAATLTAPVVCFNLHDDFVRSGVYSSVHAGVRRQRRLSLREARQLALRALADVERRLWQERAAEAQFLATLWHPDTNDLPDDRA